MATFSNIGSLFDADPFTDIEIVGKRVVQGVPLPVVKFYLKNGAQCVIGHSADGYEVTLFGSDPLDKNELRLLGLETGKEIQGIRDGFPAALTFGTFEENPGTFATRVDSGALCMLLEHIEKINNPERHAASNGQKQERVLKA